MASNVVIPPGFVHISYRITSSAVGHRCAFTVGAKLSGPTWSITDQGDWNLAVGNALKTMYDSQVTIGGFHALIGSDGPPMAADVVAGTTGTRSSVICAPPNVTHLVKKTTAFAGKRYRGRMYWPFVDGQALTEAGQINGTPLSLFQTAVVAFSNTFLSSAGNGLDGAYLLHRGEAGASVPAPTLITDFGASPWVATQRRRLERG